MFKDYINCGGPNPLHPGSSAWCDLCKVVVRHRMEEFYLLQKYMHTLKQLFCNFCSSVGNEEKNFRSYDLMIAQSACTYRMQAEGRA